MFSIVSSDGKAVANLSTGAFLPEGILSLYDGLGSKRTFQLDGLSGLTVYDSGGTNAVASFGRTLLGAGAQVTVNGIKVHDYAEVLDLFDCRGLAPGMVVSESADGKGIQLSSEPYDPAAVGVISGAGSFEAGMRIGSRVDGSTDNPVAVAGRVYVWVNSESGAISVGDLLVNSSTPGVAMRGADNSRLIGTVIGKALEPYSAKEKSLIRMLVLNH